MKNKLLFIMVFFCLVGCSSSKSSERSDIVNWAKQIVSLENRLQSEINKFKPLSDTIVSRPPTSNELSQLTSYSNNVTALYNEIITITPPADAKIVHEKYIDSYSKTADYMRYYVIAVKQNDLNYFDKSVIAAQDANRIGAEAYSGFESLLNKYSISCEEINFCE